MVMFNGLRTVLGPLELLKRTVKETIDDDCASIAAQLAYYFALALFPALLFVVALASYLPFGVPGCALLAQPDLVQLVVSTIIFAVLGLFTHLKRRRNDSLGPVET